MATIGPISQYDILRKLARGGMGEVYLARQTGIEGFAKEVVIKRIHSNYSEDPQFVGMFLQEARIAALLDHPNIVQIYELGKQSEDYFIVMEYVRGLSLSRLMKIGRAALPLPVAIQIAAGVAAGLQFAHERRDSEGIPLNLVHRDISPPNILLSTSGSVKITDFGIAKIRQSVTHTQVGVIKGKWSYISPEQARGEQATPQSDIYSLGLVLYEMTTGVRAYPAGNDKSLLRAVASGQVPPPELHMTNYPEDLRAVLMRALEPDPHNRYTECQELQEDLLALLVNRQIVTSPAKLGQFVAQHVDQPAPTEDPPGPADGYRHELKPADVLAVAPLPTNEVVLPLSHQTVEQELGCFIPERPAGARGPELGCFIPRAVATSRSAPTGARGPARRPAGARGPELGCFIPRAVATSRSAPTGARGPERRPAGARGPELDCSIPRAVAASRSAPTGARGPERPAEARGPELFVPSPTAPIEPWEPPGQRESQSAIPSSYAAPELPHLDEFDDDAETVMVDRAERPDALGTIEEIRQPPVMERAADPTSEDDLSLLHEMSAFEQDSSVESWDSELAAKGAPPAEVEQASGSLTGAAGEVSVMLRRPGSTLPWVLLMAVLAAAAGTIGTWILLSQSSRNRHVAQPEEAPPVTTADTRPAATQPTPDAAPRSEEGGVSSDTAPASKKVGAAGAGAGASTPPAHRITRRHRKPPPRRRHQPAPPKTPDPPETEESDKASLSLKTEPITDVYLSGRHVGTTPLKVQIPRGKVVLELRNTKLGIRATRSLQVTGSQLSTRFVFGRGILGFKLSEGHKVLLDGKPLGLTPISPMLVYEGHHDVIVKDLASDKTLQRQVTVAAGKTTWFALGER